MTYTKKNKSKKAAICWVRVTPELLKSIKKEAKRLRLKQHEVISRWKTISDDYLKGFL